MVDVSLGTCDARANIDAYIQIELCNTHSVIFLAKLIWV